MEGLKGQKGAAKRRLRARKVGVTKTFGDGYSEEDPGKGPKVRPSHSSSPPPSRSSTRLSNLPPSCCNPSPGRRAGVSGDRGDVATSLFSSARLRRRGRAAGGGREGMRTAAQRAAPGGVAVTGATGARARSVAAALPLQQRAPAAAAEAAGGGESLRGWE